MNSEELAFFNVQLAGMIRSGIPLEGGIRQLTASMRRGTWRREMELLCADLSAGRPLARSLEARRVPVLYKQMVDLGARSGDLPGVLTQVADYYARVHSLRARLRGMLVYPAMLLAASILLSGTLAFMAWVTYQEVGYLMEGWGMGQDQMRPYLIAFWIPPLMLVLCAMAGLVLAAVPGVRDWVRWKVPGVKDVHLARLASTLATLMQGGLTFRETLAFQRALASSRRLRAELDAWQESMASGHGRFPDMIPEGSVVPGIFVWVVGNSGDDLARGFRQAAEIYQARSEHRYELFLYFLMPASVLLLGLMILGQVVVLARIMIRFMDIIG